MELVHAAAEKKAQQTAEVLAQKELLLGEANEALRRMPQPEEEQPWLQRCGEPPNLDPHFPS